MSGGKIFTIQLCVKTLKRVKGDLQECFVYASLIISQKRTDDKPTCI